MIFDVLKKSWHIIIRYKMEQTFALYPWKNPANYSRILNFDKCKIL